MSGIGKGDMDREGINKRASMPPWSKKVTPQKLLVQFMAQHCQGIAHGQLGDVQRTKVCECAKFERFRHGWNAEYQGGFVVHSKAFDGTKRRISDWLSNLEDRPRFTKDTNSGSYCRKCWTRGRSSRRENVLQLAQQHLPECLDGRISNQRRTGSAALECHQSVQQSQIEVVRQHERLSIRGK